MRVTKEDIKKAIENIIEFQYNFNQAKKIIDENKLNIEQVTIGDQPYNEVIKEGIDYCNELDTLLEAAKESLIDELDESTISLLNKLNRFDEDLIQDYYMSEKYNNLTFIVNRAKKIKPLYTKRRVPLFIKRKYRETVLCFLDGRFDACCAMCRSIVEILLKDLCQEKCGGKGSYEKESLDSLINMCGKFKILNKNELISASRIRKTGNESMHSSTSKNEQETLISIEDIQKILRGIEY